MTGKEALNLLFCTSEGLPEHKVYECKKILEKELEELTKYKRAFEILKDKGVCVRHDRLYFDYEIYIKSTKEEVELLEELMNENKS